MGKTHQRVSYVWHKITSDGETPVLEIMESGVLFHGHHSQIHPDSEW